MELKATTRTVFGKKTKSLRNTGLIPAEMFGHNVPNLHLSIPEKDFAKVYRTAGEHTMVDLITDDGKKNPVLILNVARDAMSGKVLAIDLYRVRMDEKIKTKVPVEFTGTAPATKIGLVVVKVLNEIEVEAFPQDIPHRFTVDLNTLENLGQSIHVENLKVPQSVRILVNPETVVVTVHERVKEEVAPPPTATAESAPLQAGVPAAAEEEKKEKTGEAKTTPQTAKEK